jgi:hypothetical protein
MTVVAHRRQRLPGHSGWSPPPLPRDGQRIAFVYDTGDRYFAHVGTFRRAGVYADGGPKMALWSQAIVAWAPIRGRAARGAGEGR